MDDTRATSMSDSPPVPPTPEIASRMAEGEPSLRARHSTMSTMSHVEPPQEAMLQAELVPSPRPSLHPSREEESPDEEIRIDSPTFYDKLFVTICTFGAQLCLKLTIRLQGPTMLDLAELLHVHPTSLTLPLTARAVGYFLGAVGAGLVYRYLNRIVVLSLMLFIMGVTLVLIPVVPSLIYLFPVFLAQGLTFGVIDPGCSTQVIDAWGDKSGPFLHFMYIGYGAGAIMAPQIARPFLSTKAQEAVGDSPHYQGLAGEEIRVQKAFFYSSGIHFAFGTLLMSFLICRPYVRFTPRSKEKTRAMVFPGPEQRRRSTIGDVGDRRRSTFRKSMQRFLSDRLVDPNLEDPSRKGFKAQLKNWRKMVLLTLAGWMLFLCDGSQICASTFLVTFAVKNPMLDMTRQQAADLDTIFWVFFTLSRAASVFLAVMLTSVELLSGLLTLLFVTASLLIAFPWFNLSLTWSRIVFQVIKAFWGAAESPLIASFLNLIRPYTVIHHFEASYLISILAWSDVITVATGEVLSTDETKTKYLYSMAALSYWMVVTFFGAILWGKYVVGELPEIKNKPKKKRRWPWSKK